MNHPLRCRCGTVQGHIVRSITATRAICYCHDCQAYARFLGTPGIVDESGGTQVVASLPRHVAFTVGHDAISCMSLGERGILRWYASCCCTPLGNTPRSPRVPYVGLVHSCLDSGSASLRASFGRRCIKVNTGSARHRVRSTPMATTAAVIVLMTGALGSRLTGTHRDNPFFDAGTGTPIRRLRVLSETERAQVYRLRES